MPAADTAWLLLRGLETLDVRMARQTESAAVIAERLRSHPAVTEVRYPGFGGLLSFDVRDADAARRVETSTTLIANMTSLGGVASRIEARARWEGARVPPGLLRLSVGLEDADALWLDLEGALGALVTMRFLDRIRYQGAPKTPQEADRLALRQLSGRGADLAKPRHVIHFLYFADGGRRAHGRRGDHRGVVDGERGASDRHDRPVVRESGRPSHDRTGDRRSVSLVVRERRRDARRRVRRLGGRGEAVGTSSITS